MTNRKKILFIGPTRSPFVKNDIRILKEKYHLQILDSEVGRGLEGIFNLLLLYVKAAYHIAIKVDGLYVWFSDYPALVPTLVARILNKPSWVVAGGFDVGFIPEFNYGAVLNPVRWFFVKNSFILCQRIISVSEYVQESLSRLLPQCKLNSVVVHNSLSPFIERDYQPTAVKRKIDFLTVSQTDTIVEFHIKGLDKFIRLASLLPENNFVIAGIRSNALDYAEKLADSLNNVTILPGLLDLEKHIVPLYQKSKVYCQFSREESFGLAVVESMHYGCKPMVFNNGALPEVVQNPHFVFDQTDSDETLAKNASDMLHESFDERELYDLSTIYSYENRKKKLLEVVNF